jgi:hypothetical protein
MLIFLTNTATRSTPTLNKPRTKEFTHSRLRSLGQWEFFIEADRISGTGTINVSAGRREAPNQATLADREPSEPTLPFLIYAVAKSC